MPANDPDPPLARFRQSRRDGKGGGLFGAVGALLAMFAGAAREPGELPQEFFLVAEADTLRAYAIARDGAAGDTVGEWPRADVTVEAVQSVPGGYEVDVRLPGGEVAHWSAPQDEPSAAVLRDLGAEL